MGGAGDGQGGNASGAAGGSTTASSGDDGSGVGSGGTGVSTADAGIGSVDGAGSIIVGGLRYNTDTAVVNLEDAPGLQLGMSVKVTGPVNADFTSGIARRIDSAVDIRGPLSSVDLAQGSFVILGTTVTTDNATVWADSSGLAAIAPNATLQVWGLPAAPGVLRATRVEQHAPAAPILTGTVQNLDSGTAKLHARRLRRRLRRRRPERQPRRAAARERHPRARARQHRAAWPPAGHARAVVVPGADGRRHARPAHRRRHRLRRTRFASGPGHPGRCFFRTDHRRAFRARSAMA